MKTVIIAHGNTIPHKETLKANGFRWAPNEKVWVCLPDQDDETAYDRIERGLATLNGVKSRTEDLDFWRHVIVTGTKFAILATVPAATPTLIERAMEAIGRREGIAEGIADRDQIRAKLITARLKLVEVIEGN